MLYSDQIVNLDGMLNACVLTSLDTPLGRSVAKITGSAIVRTREQPSQRLTPAIFPGPLGSGRCELLILSLKVNDTISSPTPRLQCESLPWE